MGRRSKSTSAFKSPIAAKKDSKQALEQPVSEQIDQTPEKYEPFEAPLLSKQAAFALLWLLVYSFGMFTLPFGAFFGTRYILEHNFHIEGFANTCGSVFAAVLMVNVIIVMYALRGFQEAEEDEDEGKQEQGEGAQEEPKKDK